MGSRRVVVICVVSAMLVAAAGAMGLTFLGYNCIRAKEEKGSYFLCGVVMAFSLVADILVVMWYVGTVVKLLRHGLSGCVKLYDCCGDSRVDNLTTTSYIKAAIKRNDGRNLKEVMENTAAEPYHLWRAYKEIHPNQYDFLYSRVEHSVQIFECLLIAVPDLRSFITIEGRATLQTTIKRQKFSQAETEKLLYVMLLCGHFTKVNLSSDFKSMITAELNESISPYSLLDRSRIVIRRALKDNVYTGAGKLVSLPPLLQKYIVFEGHVWLGDPGNSV